MTVRVLVTATRIGIERSLRQRGALVFTAGFYLLVTHVLSTVWRVAAGANGGEVVGYSAVALTWYIATTECTVISLPQRMIETVGEDIASRHIEVELLRPADPLVLRVSLEVGMMLPRLAICATMGASYSWLLGGAPPSPLALLLAVPALVLAVTLNITAQHAFAGASFWVRDAHGAWFLYQKLVFLVGGMLLPLQVLPRSVELVARVLPFSAMAYVPGRIASGHLEPELLLIQVAWLGAAVWIARRVYAAGTLTLTGAAG